MLPTAQLLAVIGSRQSWNHEQYPRLLALLIPSDEMMFSNNKMCKTMLSFETLEADIKKN